MGNKQGRKATHTLYHEEVALWAALVEKVLVFGDDKHGVSTWGETPREKWYAALMRHIGRYEAGETFDPETGINHLAHAMSNLIMIARTR